MANTDKGDLFSRMLQSDKGTPKQNKNDDTVSSAEIDTDILDDSKGVGVTEDVIHTENSSVDINSSLEVDAPKIDEYIPFSDEKLFTEETKSKKKFDFGTILKKLPIKKIVPISIVCVVLIITGYIVLGCVIPAGSSAKKIQSGYLSNEISDIYNNKIIGNGLREKIFLNKISDYPEKIKNAYMNGELNINEANKILSELVALHLLDSDKINSCQKYISSIQTSKDAYEKAEKLFNSGSFELALAEYTKVIEDDSNYESAQAKIKECSKTYKEKILSQTSSLKDDDDYLSSITALENAVSVLPDDSDLSAKLKDVKNDYAIFLKEKALSEGKEYLSKNDFENVFKIIDKALEYAENDAELKKFKDFCISEYETKVLNEVNAYVKDYDYNAALDLLEEAKKMLPDNENFKSKYSEIEAKKPVSLSTMTMLNSSDFNWNTGAPKDPFGNDYSNASNYVINTGWLGGGDYGEFRLYSKYKRLTGRIAPYTEIGENDESYIQIFADDELVYTSPAITRKTDAFKFNVDIGNAEYIKIVFNGNDNYCNIILSDLMLLS